MLPKIVFFVRLTAAPPDFDSCVESEKTTIEHEI